MPADLRIILYNSKKRVDDFRKIRLSDQVRLISSISANLQKDIFTKLTDKEQVNLLEQLSPQEAAKLLMLMKKDSRDELIDKLTVHSKEEVVKMMSYPQDTAAGIMSLDFITVESTDKIDSIAKEVMSYEKKTGRIPAIIVLEKNQLRGYVPGYKLAVAVPKDRVEKFIKPIIEINYDTKVKELIKLFSNDPKGKVAVMNGPQVIGIIFSEDLLQIASQQKFQSLGKFAGVKNEETVFDTAKMKFMYRYKWLIINLGTAFLAAFTVSMFEEVIEKNVLLAVYMPIVAGMGGNAGTQTLAVMVRGMTLHDLNLKTVFIALQNEFLAGLYNGIINGLIVFSIVYFVNKEIMVGIVLGIAMVINLVVSATFGTLVPYIMNKLGKDPASSATIFITTATDVLGFLAFLGLASLLL